MRFVNIGPLQKVTDFVNFRIESRKFSFGLVLTVAILTVLVTGIQQLAIQRTKPNPLLSPLSQNRLRPEALGISSESAELIQSIAIPKDNIANDTKPPIIKKVENKGIGSTEPKMTPAPKTPEKPVSVTPNVGRINFTNNKFGIYTNNAGADLDLAAELVNSNGGDWGWILVPMNVHEGGTDNWNSLFSKMSQKHLIPIIQLIEPDARNKVPREAEIDDIAKFLGSLSWPTKLKVVSAFNEVNASEYWGGKIDPEGYAKILNRLIDQLKLQSSDFFVLNGAFNASAQTGDPTNVNCIKTDLGVNSCYLSEIGYLAKMDSAVPGIFKKLDGWASHVYPFPAYKGRPGDTRVGAESAFEAGRNTIHSYQFELRLLKRDYGITLPVFITETSWPHKEGQTIHPEWYDAATVAGYYKQAFVSYFLPDRNIVAVAPFSLTNNFDNFAFVATDGTKFPQWDALVGISKTSGNPPR